MHEEDIERLFQENLPVVLKRIESIPPSVGKNKLLIRFVTLLENNGDERDNYLFEEAVLQLLMLGSAEFVSGIVGKSKRQFNPSFLKSVALSLSSAINGRIVGGQLEESV